MSISDSRLADIVRDETRRHLRKLRHTLATLGVDPKRWERLDPPHADLAADYWLGIMEVGERTGHPWDRNRGYVRGTGAKKRAGE